MRDIVSTFRNVSTKADQAQITQAMVIAYGTEVGLSPERFGDCLAGSVGAEIQAEAEISRLLAGGGTPAFLFGRRQSDGLVKIERRLSGAKPITEFARLLDELLTTEGIANRQVHTGEKEEQ